TFITTSQLALALREAGGVDIYASDASLMQMMEVAYEIRDTIGYIAGSEETEPLDAFGYPYFFKQISSDTYPTPLQAGIYATEAYALNCQAMSVPYTYSLIDAKMLADFSKLIDEWTAAAMASGEAAAIKKVRDNGQKFGNPDNKDLYAFIAAVNGVTASSNLRNKGRTLLRFMSEKLVKANRVSDKYRQARGVSIYLPDWKYDPAYDTLQFSKDGSWDEFIKWLAR
ncbi:MAG: clostripain-related cysteine peptidase, partial [Elusimicrobiaceae bacterium]